MTNLPHLPFHTHTHTHTQMVKFSLSGAGQDFIQHLPAHTIPQLPTHLYSRLPPPNSSFHWGCNFYSDTFHCHCLEAVGHCLHSDSRILCHQRGAQVCHHTQPPLLNPPLLRLPHSPPTHLAPPPSNTVISPPPHTNNN